MELSGILNILTMFFIIITIAVIALLLIFLTMKKRDELRIAQIAIRDDVRERREQRLVLIEQALAMFANGNGYADSLSKLASLYRSIDNETKEIMWEDKYIKIMKKFLTVAKKQSPANMRDAWKMLNTSVNENEMALDAAREAYTASQDSMAQFDSFPQKYILLAGEKLSLSIRYAEYIKKKYDEQLAKQTSENKEEASPSGIDEDRERNE